MSPVYEFSMFVPGRPAAQGSKRHVGKGVLVEQSKAVGPWRTLVAWHASQQWRGAPLDGAVRVRLEFVMPRPVSTPKRSTPPAVKRPDLDKTCRAVFDALTSVCWRDDSQVVEVYASKRIAELGEPSGALIQIGSVVNAEKILSVAGVLRRDGVESSRALPSGPGTGAA